jgi:hypothetical protein
MVKGWMRAAFELGFVVVIVIVLNLYIDLGKEDVLAILWVLPHKHGPSKVIHAHLFDSQ